MPLGRPARGQPSQAALYWFGQELGVGWGGSGGWGPRKALTQRPEKALTHAP